ncbi:MAG: sodium:proton antiporter [Gordonia sp. (in: high G+C Gram-positive bacteria)]|uniref:cation:proton antiporter n=1 Tax=Gordonia sp. (in: high G+C Gram-positive bacteria) TaxID=84139 RepID=UPI0039E54476
MIEYLVIAGAGLLLIAAATMLSPRVGIATPLLLVGAGVAASYLPIFHDFHLNPELILQGVLPPLLYAAAVAMPAMSFRREFGAISGLSVLLVVASSLVLGLFFMLVIPSVGFAWGVALGAVISPTDAVATSIIKKTSVSKRVVAILEGESLLNDASALVLLRTAIVATAASFSFWGAVGSFSYSVVVALLIGIAVGTGNLLLRRRLHDPAVNTVISFTVPFLGAIPAELLEASGLVAAVVAGLITGFRQPRMLPPRNRLSDRENWRTIELVLEGAIFLTMGLQIRTIVEDVQRDHEGVLHAVLLAAIALLITVAIRAAYVAPLLAWLGRRSNRIAKIQPKVADLQEKISTPEGKSKVADRMAQRSGREPTEAHLERFSTRLRRSLADFEYFLRAPLGWREGAVVVWAGMRGAVTVAAAQTLPSDTPNRSVLILIAYTVALLSLVVQGGTIGPLLGVLSRNPDEAELAAERELEEADRRRLHEIMREAYKSVPVVEIPEDTPRDEQFELRKKYRNAIIDAQRAALLDAREDGIFDADVLKDELTGLDADQIALSMRGPASHL